MTIPILPSSTVTDDMVERAWAAIVGADVAGQCFVASLTRGDLRTGLEAASAAQQPTHSQLFELDDASNACLELAAKHGYATGHGDTVGDMIREFAAQIPNAQTHIRHSLRSVMPPARDVDGWAFAKLLSEALLKVRPLGGSELFVKRNDQYYADPVYCGQKIDELRDSLDKEIRARIRVERAPSVPRPNLGGEA